VTRCGRLTSSSHFCALNDASDDGDVCVLCGHAVRFFDLMGIIISVDPRKPSTSDSCIKFTIDDSTALVDCVVWNKQDPYADHKFACLCLGNLLHVHGRVSRFRGKRQLTVDRFWLEDNSMAECLHWIEARELWHSVYSHPLRLPAQLASSSNKIQERSVSANGGANKAGEVQPTDAQVLQVIRSIILGSSSRSRSRDEPAASLRDVAKCMPGVSQNSLKLVIARLVEASTLYVVSSSTRDEAYRLAVSS